MKPLDSIKSKLRLDLFAGFMNQRSPREQLMILAFGGIFLFFVDYVIWFSPVLKAITQTAPALSSLEIDLQGLREDKKNADVIKGRYQQYEEELANLEKGLEAANQIPVLLENLSQMASSSGVRITSLTPVESGQSGSAKLYSAQPIEMKATAGAHELGNFLSVLETGPTVFKIRNLSISPNPLNPKKHLIEVKMETYRKA
jgi:type IV pilus assembly protein PilO